jgi:hypothetical protein
MSEAVLILPNTDRFQQVEDYVRGCTNNLQLVESGQYLVEVVQPRT